MNAYLALTKSYLLLTLRDRAALFFSYIMPLVFFFLFGQMMHAERGTAILVVNMVLTLGILGTGLFGAGMRSIADRETNILRRFKVAPISPTPMLVASFVVGLLNFVPVFVLVLVLANRLYGMAIPHNLASLTIFVLVGVVAFRAIGLMLGSVANSMQEAQILIQSLYMPMLFLSGATIPVSVMPEWVQTAAQFLPATHLFTGMQSIMGSGESIMKNLAALGALVLTILVGGFIGVKLFRWEKEEKLPASAKLWVLGVLAPFLLMGIYQARSKENVAKNKVFDREISRRVAYLVKNTRIFAGDGTVVENGSVLVRDGKIAEIYQGDVPTTKELKATEIDGAGKTIIPGLIDVHVHLGAPGGFYEKSEDYAKQGTLKHALAAYLYSGVTAVRSLGDATEAVLQEREKVRVGGQLGAELFVAGPLFTIEGGHGTEYLKADWMKQLPETARKMMTEDFIRTPHNPDEARQQVDALKKRGVDAIKAVMEAGRPGMLFNRMDASVLNAIVGAAHNDQLPASVHTGSMQDVADAIAAHADSIEHGSMQQLLNADLFSRMKQQGVSYDPTLMVLEGVMALTSGKSDPLERSLVQQVGPAKLIAGTKKYLQAHHPGSGNFTMDIAKQNLLLAYQNGVTLVTGSDAGNPLTVHGPTVHREMQLWVEAGVPPAVALQAATWNAARLLHASQRIGLVKKGYEATFLLVDGNPTKDITATERISSILFKGERIRRTDLFEDEH